MKIYKRVNHDITRIQVFGSYTISLIETNLNDVFAMINEVLHDYIDIERNKIRKTPKGYKDKYTSKVKINVNQDSHTPKSKSMVYWGVAPGEAHEMIINKIKEKWD